MKLKFRYVAIDPARSSLARELGKASYLDEFLTHCQTDARGRVNYGRPITYKWICGRMKISVCRKTLQRWMGRLQDLARVEVVAAPGGMRVRILNQKKWPSSAQLSLFPAPAPRCISSGKPCAKPAEKLWGPVVLGRTKMSPPPGQKCHPGGV
jgi:hypothetical protein